MNIYNITRISKLGSILIVYTENENKYHISIEKACLDLGKDYRDFINTPEKIELVDNGDEKGLKWK